MASDPAHAISLRKALGIAAIALIGIMVGSWVVLRKSSPSPVATLPQRQPAAVNTNGMVWIVMGTFAMGSGEGNPDEQPIHDVTVDGFFLDRTEVTNEEFARFVEATRYITIAERRPNPSDYPTVPVENLVPGSVVFSPPPGLVSLDDHAAWWKYVKGADWRHPEGPGSSLRGREKHPVVHVCWEDAGSYAAWLGKRLPTEAEWEYASRGGKVRAPYVWGDEKTPANRWLANIWQGRFPSENLVEDGFSGTAAVASFPPNGYGLYDMAGNVWEWCQDWYRPDYYAISPTWNPPGPPDSFDPNEPGIAKKVMRGGSFMCSDLYCSGYRPSARMKSSTDTGLSHTGFRCAWSPR